MELIVNTALDWGIGNNGDLLYHIREDMKFFRQHTLGKAVLMGRKTLESFPGGKPLPDRVNLVLTSNPDYQKEGIVVCHSSEEALALAKQYPEVMLIGGAAVYEQFLPYCERAWVTRVQASKPADTYFPNLDELEHWECVWTSEPHQAGGIEFYFTEYVNHAVQEQ
ncbi:MAG: dihydrofolate reductase [Butyricicoccaceae bacterium]